MWRGWGRGSGRGWDSRHNPLLSTPTLQRKTRPTQPRPEQFPGEKLLCRENSVSGCREEESSCLLQRGRRTTDHRDTTLSILSCFQFSSLLRHTDIWYWVTSFMCNLVYMDFKGEGNPWPEFRASLFVTTTWNLQTELNYLCKGERPLHIQATLRSASLHSQVFKFIQYPLVCVPICRYISLYLITSTVRQKFSCLWFREKSDADPSDTPLRFTLLFSVYSYIFLCSLDIHYLVTRFTCFCVNKYFDTERSVVSCKGDGTLPRHSDTVFS